MEDKLLELKEEFCKWYCPNREEENIGNINLCFYCQIDEYIRHIRDELN